MKLTANPTNYYATRSTHRGGKSILVKSFRGKFSHATLIKRLKLGFLYAKDGAGAFLNFGSYHIAFFI
jgi:hypothetical protein